MRPPAFLERASLADAEALALLEGLCHSHPWTRRHFEQALDGERGRSVLVLRSCVPDGDPVRGILGFAVLEVVVDEAHIHNLAVHPGVQRSGLGQVLLLALLSLATRQGARTAYLEVRRSNAAALGLYLRHGFRAAGERRDYYQEPREDALVLSRTGLESSLF